MEKGVYRVEKNIALGIYTKAGFEKEKYVYLNEGDLIKVPIDIPKPDRKNWKDDTVKIYRLGSKRYVRVHIPTIISKLSMNRVIKPHRSKDYKDNRNHFIEKKRRN